MKLMYSWITRTWNPVGGECPIHCPYCYVRDLCKARPVIAAKYSGEPRLTGPWPRFKGGEVVFVCDMTDLFAMPRHIWQPVLLHCGLGDAVRPINREATYVFQTKRPEVMLVADCYGKLPPHRILGTTVETDYDDRCIARLPPISQLRQWGEETFVTVEPILRFSPGFSHLLATTKPSFVNIGAASKSKGLPEPTKAETLQLIADLRAAGIKVLIKDNLRRIVGKEA